MPPSKPAYDIDWIFSNVSNVHVANHRDWFTSFTPFTTTFNGGLDFTGGGSGVHVAGIGVVELPTKTHPTRSGAAYQASIVLQDVLYAPDALCNIIGLPIMAEHDCFLNYGTGTGKVISDTNGACVGLLDLHKLARLRLRGQSAKQTSLDLGAMYIIRASWADSERARWADFQSSTIQKESVSHGGAMGASRPLTAEEKQWMKTKYGNEFHFLRAFGLSIYEEEDREEGRRILRAHMACESDEDDDDESQCSFERELEQDPTSHFADHYFSKEELGWIKAGYGHSGNFLRSYGLKFYNDEDCREGKAIVKAMLSEDEDEEIPELI
ncbi:MAG: hypothetical protein Q9222_005763 [Ikaeria aurantiellina]